VPRHNEQIVVPFVSGTGNLKKKKEKRKKQRETTQREKDKSNRDLFIYKTDLRNSFPDGN
jgi:hypothetical protein